MLVRKCTWIQTVSKTSQKVFQVWKQIVRQWLVEVRQWIWLELLFQIIICLQVQQFQLYILRSWINLCGEWRAEDIKMRFQVLKFLSNSTAKGIQLNFMLCCKFTRNVCFFQQRKITKSVITSLPGEQWQVHLEWFNVHVHLVCKYTIALKFYIQLVELFHNINGQLEVQPPLFINNVGTKVTLNAFHFQEHHDFFF